MKKVIKVAGLSLAILGASFSFAAQAAQKIGYVSTTTVLAQMAKKANLNTKLTNEFKSRVAEIQRLEKKLRTSVDKLKRDHAVMSDAARTKLQRDIQQQEANYQLKVNALREDQAKRGGEEQRKLVTKLQKTVQTIAAKKGYTIVLDKNALIYAVASDDLTNEVLKVVK